MQQDDVEVQFCDLCGTSVPLTDLESGAAVRHQAKTIGACCLAVLRRGESPLASPGGAAERGPRGTAAARPNAGLVPMAIAFAVAVLGATIFLELEIQGLATRQEQFRSAVAEAMGADSDVLRTLDQAVDGVARRTDLDGLGERLNGFGGAFDAMREDRRRQHEELGRAIAALDARLVELAAQRVDYRPLFDDLRQQIQRQAADLAELRSSPAAGGAAPQAGPAAPVEPVPAPATGLPQELAAQVARLADADAAVRFEAVDRLLASRNLAVLPHLVPMTRDADGFVRRLTVEGLRDFRQPAAVEALLDALGDSDPIVADTAWSSLKKLTGQKLPFDAAATSRDARARQQERWREWWQANKDGFGS